MLSMAKLFMHKKSFGPVYFLIYSPRSFRRTHSYFTVQALLPTFLFSPQFCSHASVPFSIYLYGTWLHRFNVSGPDGLHTQNFTIKRAVCICHLVNCNLTGLIKTMFSSAKAWQGGSETVLPSFLPLSLSITNIHHYISPIVVRRKRHALIMFLISKHMVIYYWSLSLYTLSLIPWPNVIFMLFHHLSED